MNTTHAIDICAALRSRTAKAMSHALQAIKPISEKTFCKNVKETFLQSSDIYAGGWYAPPPFGLAALFGNPPDYQRLRFDTLRKEEFWPQDNYILEDESVGILYASPIDLYSATIGDFGTTIYCGKDKRILNHLSNSLTVLEAAIDQIDIGMELRHVHDLTQKIIAQHNLTNARTITWTDTAGSNLGHTIPWSYEEPNSVEKEIIAKKDQKQISELISHKRVNVNRLEQFKIPKTIAFTLEARLESLADPLLPNVFYHLIVSFKDGEKTILANFNDLFQTIGMPSIRSKF